MRRVAIAAACMLALVGAVALALGGQLGSDVRAIAVSTGVAQPVLAFDDTSTPEARALAEAAMSQVGVTIEYDASYVQLGYPGGDVPMRTGVCTDVIVRALRDCGTDLQAAVHEDMLAAFEEYPQRWDLDAPDSNIDHRRVPNLQTYFERQGISLPVTDRGSEYLPGDIVTWSVGGRPHIGIVSTQVAPDGTRFCIAHNIGRGTRVEDFLFRYEITGHYRWFS